MKTVPFFITSSWLSSFLLVCVAFTAPWRMFKLLLRPDGDDADFDSNTFLQHCDIAELIKRRPPIEFHLVDGVGIVAGAANKSKSSRRLQNICR
jgi:hypothetical protein